MTNAPLGVRIDAFGDAGALATFRARIESPPLPGVRVDSVESSALVLDREPATFEIRASQTRTDESGADVALAADLPTCAACLAELWARSSRRFRYPFIACAQCGPRYTISRASPWDRVRTSMAEFPLCEACAAEYADPEDRRFHAESTACAACGPSLRLLDLHCEWSVGNERALAGALETLRGGGIVAVQGIGGFHLACDASSERVVQRLRDRKHRPRRPFAVMFRSLDEVEKHAVVCEQERRLLGSDVRPIVLLHRRTDSSLAHALAPENQMLGAVLAYTPLHTLLLDDFGGPLVMTSANRSSEPILYRADASVPTLLRLADLVLANDREIVAPCDDSVAIASPRRPIVMRRSRGYVPRSIHLVRPLQRTVLAVGGHWTNTICVAAGARAWSSGHVGDIESPESVVRLEDTIERWLGQLGVEPEIVAHDLHPGYESTRLAQRFPGVRKIGVQHHHAHMAAVLGEHGVDRSALGLVWDGTGAGLDGTAWGGELFYGDVRSARRIATFRPIPLAGGDRAIREPWRLALAVLRDAFDGEAPLEAIGLFEVVPREEFEGVLALLERPALCVAAHGVGRYFDAVAAVLLGCPVASYSGEFAQALGFLATGRTTPPYPFAVDMTASPWQVDLRPAVRALVDELEDGRSRAQLADRFHATLAAAGETIARAGARSTGEVCVASRGRRPRVVLAGGCFQNPILVDALEERLGRDFEVLRSVELPPGDGGLAFGQVLVADAIAADATVVDAKVCATTPAEYGES